MEIRVRGRVQGVGFRPTVWRIAHELDLAGEVLNDGEGVLVRVRGARNAVEAFVKRMAGEPPPLARIDAIETRSFEGELPDDFRIAESLPGEARTQVTPDAAVCRACAQEVLDPCERRFRYPFANCTHCGPRLTVVRAIPYDRANTSMAVFPLCEACLSEYRRPADRRFHAEAIACRECGPRARLIRFDGRATGFEEHSTLDDIDAAASLIEKGEIVAIKGLGGYQLACDATRSDVVGKLRKLKRRDAKPFALIARDLDVVRRYCRLTDEEAELMASPAGPIVLLPADGRERLPEEIAPGLSTLGFLLPTTPLHLMILRRFATPLVMTSGNLSEEPQAIQDAGARERLGGIASYALVHDREIVNRVDDSVARTMAGRVRLIRRARGYAPAPIALPRGFESAPDILALGGELKATFCLVKDGEAVLSQHQGDLENEPSFEDYRKNLALYAELFAHRPAAIVADAHPEYLSTKLAHEVARSGPTPLIEVQHHHAHLAACLAENDHPLDGPRVLGVVLDGLGLGDDGTIWGGEFLLGAYRGCERLGTFKPVAMPGGAQAVREPWRNLYAHLMAEMGWAEFARKSSELEVYADLARRPRRTLDAMIESGLNSPRASSCGRLFDAVAAALNLCRERQAYEGEAGARLEAIVDSGALGGEGEELAYPMPILELGGSGLPYLEPLPMWRALLDDLVRKIPPGVISARFHRGLAEAVAGMTSKLARREAKNGPRFDTVALSGGCFQNRVLFEKVVRRLEQSGFKALTHAEVPANDGGLALGQAAIGAARLIEK
ncbi:MAG: carbamoyltransferase HypF [Hyphomicrobiales bacterium]|nr:carbamoyltransferase HypF [Hyphomicrobiales bacterium]